MTPNREIEIEQIAATICRQLYIFSGSHWNYENLACLFEVGVELVSSVGWLLNKKYIWIVNGGFCLTPCGIEYVEGMKENSVVGKASDLYKFKDESLTGIKEIWNAKTKSKVSRKSEIKSAVLPGTPKHHDTKTPEDIIIQNNTDLKRKQRLASELGVTLSKLEILVKEGRVGICKKCGETGIFDAAHGDYVKKTCRRCRNKTRRERHNARQNKKVC